MISQAWHMEDAAIWNLSPKNSIYMLEFARSLIQGCYFHSVQCKFKPLISIASTKPNIFAQTADGVTARLYTLVFQKVTKQAK